MTMETTIRTSVKIANRILEVRSAVTPRKAIRALRKMVSGFDSTKFMSRIVGFIIRMIIARTATRAALTSLVRLRSLLSANF